MKTYKRILIILLILSVIFPIILSTQTYATNGPATIYTDATSTEDNYSHCDKDGNILVWKNSHNNTFLEQQKNYDNLYCMDAGLIRETNYKVIEERYIIDYLNIDSSTKGSIFENAVYDYNSMLWFIDNMYLWQYDSTNLSNNEIEQLKLSNIEAIKDIILAKKDYLQSLNIAIDEQWLDTTFAEIDMEQSKNKVFVNNFHEDTLVHLNKAIIWQIARNTLGASYNDSVNTAENLLKDHIEFDGNVMCLSKATSNSEHYDIYEIPEKNDNIQKAFKAYYYAMLKTAQENNNYTRYQPIDIISSSAKTNLNENKIGPFSFKNYNNNYIEGYAVTINNVEISNDLYKIQADENGEFYITFDKSILEKAGNYNVLVTVKYNYGAYRNACIIDNPYPGYQPLLAVNYNNEPLQDTDIITAYIAIKENTTEIEKAFPAIKLTKSADKYIVSEGDEVTYTILVENIGNVDLENVIINDEMLGINKTIDKLEVGKSEEITGTYTVTKTDIEKEEEITNTALVTAKYKDNNLTASATATILPKIVESEEIEKEYPNIKLTKTADKYIVSEGDKVTYTLKVENIGNVDLSNVLVKDEMIDINQTINIKTGETQTLTGTYVVTENDINEEKEIINTATVTTQYNDFTLSASDNVAIVPKVIEREEVIVEVEKEVIKVVEKEVPVEVEKVVYVEKDSSTATTKLPDTGIRNTIILIVILSTASIVAYVFNKKNKIK